MDGVLNIGFNICPVNCQPRAGTRLPGQVLPLPRTSPRSSAQIHRVNVRLWWQAMLRSGLRRGSLSVNTDLRVKSAALIPTRLSLVPNVEGQARGAAACIVLFADSSRYAVFRIT